MTTIAKLHYTTAINTDNTKINLLVTVRIVFPMLSQLFKDVVAGVTTALFFFPLLSLPVFASFDMEIPEQKINKNPCLILEIEYK